MESKHQTLQGLAFPLQPEAQRALQQLKQKMINYIQLVGARSLPQAHTWAHCATPAPAHTHVQLRARTHPSSPGYLWEHCPPRPRPYLVPFCVQLLCTVDALCFPALPSPCLHAGASRRHCPSFCPPHSVYVLTLDSLTSWP